MRKTKIIIISISIFVLLFVGGVYAYMIQQTPLVTNELVPANVTCKVIEKTDSGTALTSQKNSIKVKNTSDISAYVRVKLVSYWMKDGQVASKPSDKPEISFSDSWIDLGNDTYCCKIAIESGQETPELLTSPVFLAEEDGYIQVIEIFADTIQYKPLGAVEESWSVSVNENGMITGPAGN